jgi:hypothetical protein
VIGASAAASCHFLSQRPTCPEDPHASGRFADAGFGSDIDDARAIELDPTEDAGLRLGQASSTSAFARFSRGAFAERGEPSNDNLHSGLM